MSEILYNSFYFSAGSPFDCSVNIFLHIFRVSCVRSFFENVEGMIYYCPDCLVVLGKLGYFSKKGNNDIILIF